jgi:hypothetical protein
MDSTHQLEERLRRLFSCMHDQLTFSESVRVALLLVNLAAVCEVLGLLQYRNVLHSAGIPAYLYGALCSFGVSFVLCLMPCLSERRAPVFGLWPRKKYHERFLCSTDSTPRRPHADVQQVSDEAQSDFHVITHIGQCYLHRALKNRTYANWAFSLDVCAIIMFFLGSLL